MEIDPGDIVRLAKVEADHRGDDPTLVVLGSGRRILTSDSIRTIGARVGDAAPLTEYDDPGGDRPASLGLLWISALTKPNEDHAGDDPTLVHLANGEAVLAGESIRTLSARLSIDAGRRAVDVDMEGTERPAAIVAEHVEGVLIMSSSGARSLVQVAGGHAIACRDDPSRLKALIRDALPDPETPAP